MCIAVLAIALHFIPITTESGVFANVDTGIDSRTCIGYSQPVKYDHRVILGGMSDYTAEKATLSASDDVPCAKPVELRLYLW
jgi:hypothetical protein